MGDDALLTGAVRDAASGVPEAATAVRAPPCRVAAIDDDRAVLTLVRRVLDGYDVVEFERPEAALRAFADGLRPHLVISDVQMPGMSGFDLHEAVRRIAPLRSVPFVYLTALADRDSLRRGMGQGADDYLTKPFTSSELRDAVAARLERHRALADAPAPAALHVVTMGGLSVSLGDQRLSWEARKVVELLAFLLDADGTVPVAAARQELWSGPAADNHLHVLVSRLRKMLGTCGRVTVADERLALDLDVPVQFDVAIFEAAADLAAATGRTAEIEAAIAVYGGELLSGFDSPWSDTRRAELEERYSGLLEAAAEAAADAITRERAQARLDAYYDLS